MLATMTACSGTTEPDSNPTTQAHETTPPIDQTSPATTIVSPDGTADTAPPSTLVSGPPTVFDSNEVHRISLDFAVDSYEEVIDAYVDDGSKDWLEATVVIDGATYESAGVRLKGNSSLRALIVGGFPGGQSTGLPADAEELPWLIRLDKYVDGQHHQGVTDLVVRSNNSQTALNEAVALDLLTAAGLASQDAMAVRFSVNGSDEALRLVIELPDDVWMADNFDEDGALYKAESTGDYSYRGSNPDAYDDVFDQEAGKDNADLAPLIDFLNMINNADDDTFENEIHNRLDVDSFITYLAMQDLIGNFDDIDGPGNNSYLYYDPDAEHFTIVAWDHNLAFGVGFGQPGGLGDGPPAGFPDDFQPPADFEMPTGIPGGGSNPLVDRLEDMDGFPRAVEVRSAELAALLVDSGTAQEIVDRWVTVLTSGATDLVSPQAILEESRTILERL